MAALITLFYSCNELEPNGSGRFKDNVYADTRELPDGACEIIIESGCDTFTVDTFIVIDSCEIPIKYFKKICPGTISVTFAIGGLIINNNNLKLDTTVYCDGLDTWSALWAAGNYTAAENAWNSFRSQLTIALEKQIVQEYINANIANYDCETSEGVITLASSFIQTDCKTICGEQEEEVWNLRHVICGAGCCIRYTDYCVRNGQLIIDDTRIESSPGCITVENDCRGTLGNCNNSCAGL